MRGKTAAITGAGGGIGRALTFALLKRGVDVFASDIRLSILEDLSAKTADFPGRFFPCVADVTSDASIKAFREQIEQERGHIDYWINNAGITCIGGFTETDPSAYQKVIDINLGGVIRGTREALDAMEARGKGSIANIASIAGHLPAPYMTAYNTSKHAVVGFTRSLQAELALKNSSVHVMLASPGFTDTSIISRGEAHGFPEWLSFMLTTPEKVAEEIVQGLIKQKAEIYPTLNGKIMRRMYSLLPRTTVKGSKVLFAKSIKDAFFNRLDIPQGVIATPTDLSADEKDE